MMNSIPYVANSILGVGGAPYRPYPSSLAVLMLAPPSSLQGTIGISFDHSA